MSMLLNTIYDITHHVPYRYAITSSISQWASLLFALSPISFDFFHLTNAIYARFMHPCLLIMLVIFKFLPRLNGIDDESIDRHECYGI